MSEQRCRVLPEPVGHKQRRTVGRQHLRDVVDEALRYRQGPLAEVNRHEQLSHGIDDCPHLVRGTGQAFDGLGLRDLALLDGTEDGLHLSALPLLQVQVTEARGGKGAQLLGCFDSPVSHRIGIDRKDPGSGPHAQSLGHAHQHPHDQLHLCKHRV